MYKTIIPNLLSLDTALQCIKGFNLSDNFDFYPSTKSKNKFHYSINIDNSINIPSRYDFRSGFYFKEKYNWYYKRQIFKGISLKFKFDTKRKIFSYNNLYSKIPFEIGGINPVGKCISDFINLELFLSNVIVFRGCAFKYRGDVIGIISPGFNGKTTFIKEMVNVNAQYMAEDILVINFDLDLVYPTAPFKNNFGRIINKQLEQAVCMNVSVEIPQKIDSIFWIQNSTTSIKSVVKKYEMQDVLYINSIFFLSNNFIKAYIFEEKLINKIMKIMKKINKNNNIMFDIIQDFNFNKIMKQHADKSK